MPNPTSPHEPATVSSVEPVDLQVEYLTDPLGIDVERPRFSWKLHDAKSTRGQRQTAYQVIVESDDVLLWDSGIVASSQSSLITYGGPALTSNQALNWKVRVYDKDERPSGWSAPARFTMGLLRPEDWTGEWIGHPDAPAEAHLWFRKSITLESLPKNAVIHVASLGYHELYANGVKADDRVLAPVLTRLDKRVTYVSYDVTPLMQAGENAIAIWYGPGWSRYEYFKTPQAIRVQLHGRKVDGGVIAVGSDASWRCQISSSANTGRCKYEDNGGERVDARKFVADWNAASFDDSAWPQAKEIAVTQTLSAQMMEPTRVIEVIPARAVSGDGPYKIDLGKNFTGWLSVRMNKQSAGDVVTIRVSDDARNVQDFTQMHEYICSGEPGETFQNRFNFSAGRFVTIEGLGSRPDIDDVIGYAVATDLQRTGHFRCSSQLFNDIYEADLWTYRANTIEGFTSDCPHRERLGYGEESFATAWGIGLPNYRAGAFYLKHVRDWSDVREANGWIHHTAPQINHHFGGPMWSSAGLSIAWEHYLTHGDARVLELTYPSAKRWLQFLSKNMKDGLLQNYANDNSEWGWGKFLGDWAAPGQRRERGDSPEALYFNNCVYAMNLRTAIDIATRLGERADAAAYAESLAALKQRIHEAFFDPATNLYAKGTQVQLAFALWMDIVPNHLRAKVLQLFETDITQLHRYLDMGSSGLPVLLKYLVEDAERADLLYEPLSSTVEPSFGYFLARGENTWPEYWNVDVESRIHTCYTGVSAYFIKSLAGIRPDPAHPGYQRFMIKPAIVGELTFAEASVESPYGVIRSAWKRTGSAVTLCIEVPPNSRATVYVPADARDGVTEAGRPLSEATGVEILKQSAGYVAVEVGSGSYEFNSTLLALANIR